MRKPLLPPTYFLIALALMAALRLAAPLCDGLAWPWRVGGLALLAFGAGLNLVADRAFKTMATTVKPFERSSVLVTDGVFRLTRNPMYLGMVAILIGVALMLGALSPFVAPLAFAALVRLRFIPVEERMLAETFGNDWRAYSRRTRRWL